MGASKILIVEDEAIIAMEVAEILEGLGYRVVGMVATAEKAIVEAEQTRPDLILMDFKLRGPTSGLEAARDIHERFAIPSVLVTAHAPEARTTDDEAGILGRVMKPFDRLTLQRAVEQALAATS